MFKEKILPLSAADKRAEAVSIIPPPTLSMSYEASFLLIDGSVSVIGSPEGVSVIQLYKDGTIAFRLLNRVDPGSSWSSAHLTGLLFKLRISRMSGVCGLH